MDSFFIGDLKITVPIIQGGMGVGVSMSGLASAVANMGGVGVIATVGLGLVHGKPENNFRTNNINGLITEIKKAREKSKGIIAVNIMSVLTNFSDLVETSIKEGIDIIFSGAGLPLDLPKYLSENCKTKLAPIVSSARAASIICKKWKQNFDYLPDAIVVEGPKAGGHIGFNAKDVDKDENTLEILLKDILEVVKEVKNEYGVEIPVIAGGGIFTGKDAYDIIKQGASGVQIGTRFVATEECDADLKFKQALVDSKEGDIALITSPVGMPGRTILNKFLEQSFDGMRKPKSCKFNCIRSCNPKTTSFCIADALFEAYKGNLDDGFAFAGTNGYRIKEISTVKHIFEEIIDDYQKAKNDDVSK